MSIELLTAVWSLSLGSGTDKLVLLALADYANKQGRCWPSIETLTKKTDLGERTVRNALARLKVKGYVEVMHMPGRSCVYLIHTPASAAPTPASAAPPPRHLPHPTPASAAPITVKDPPFEPSRIRGGESPLETGAEKRQSQQSLRLLSDILTKRRR